MLGRSEFEFFTKKATILEHFIKSKQIYPAVLITLEVSVNVKNYNFVTIKPIYLLFPIFPFLWGGRLITGGSDEKCPFIL